MNAQTLAALAVLPLALAACGGDDDGGSTNLTGVYEIDTWTENEAGCGSEGPSILDGNDTHFYVKIVDVFGFDVVTAGTCASLTECEAQAVDNSVDLGGLAFDGGSDSAGWTGSGYILGSSGPDTCSGEVRNYTMISAGDGLVEFTIESVTVEDVPLDGDGFCDEDAALEQAASQECEVLEVLTGTLVSEP